MGTILQTKYTTAMMPNQQRRANKGSVLRMIQMLDLCATTSQDDEAALLLGMAAEALAQLQSHSNRMRIEAVDSKDKYNQMGQLHQELEDQNDDLVKENEQLLVKCQQLEVDEQMAGWSDNSEHSECELMPATVSIEASPTRDASASETRRRSFSGDVYHQLDQFELSIDMELEEFQRLGLLSADANDKNAGAQSSEECASQASESEQTSSSCLEVLESETPCEIRLSEAPSRNPLHLLQRMFQTQDDMPMPAMMTSDSLFSLSSDCSINTRSTSDFLSLASTKRSTKMSPQPNAEWAIIE